MGAFCSQKQRVKVDVIKSNRQNDAVIADNDLKVQNGAVDAVRLEFIQTALDLLDVNESALKAGSKWTSKEMDWNEIQRSAKATLLKPETIHQGNTTLCGGITLVETMASFRPSLYSKMIISVWFDGKVVDTDGHVWGEIDPKLLSSPPAKSVRENSIADWMIATSILAECRDNCLIRGDILNHDEYLGQCAFDPKDGKTTPDFIRGLTMPWEMKKMMKDLLGCSSIDRCLCYWLERRDITKRMLDAQSKGQIKNGEVVVILLISDTLWYRSTKDKTLENSKGVRSLPEHWVRLRSIELLQKDEEDNGNDILNIAVFSYGVIQQRTITVAAFGRVLHEAIFGKLN